MVLELQCPRLDRPRRARPRYAGSVIEKHIWMRAIIPPLLFLAVAIGGLLALLFFGEGL